MTSKKLSLLLLIVSAFALVVSAQTARHPLKLDDLARFRNVGDPQISTDGQWLAYTVSTIDAKEDKGSTHIWLASYDGKTDRQITRSPSSSIATDTSRTCRDIYYRAATLTFISTTLRRRNSTV